MHIIFLLYRRYKQTAKAVGGTRDRWIETRNEGEASASTSLFFWVFLGPQSRRWISNGAKTRTRTRRVVFQKLSRTLNRVRGLYRPRPPPKYSWKCGIWSLLDTSGPEIPGGHPPTPPFSPHPPRVCAPEPIFLNVYGAQESIPRNEFRQSM